MVVFASGVFAWWLRALALGLRLAFVLLTFALSLIDGVLVIDTRFGDVVRRLCPFPKPFNYFVKKSNALSVVGLEGVSLECRNFPWTELAAPVFRSRRRF